MQYRNSTGKLQQPSRPPLKAKATAMGILAKGHQKGQD
jgi:hypothetical protein